MPCGWFVIVIVVVAGGGGGASGHVLPVVAGFMWTQDDSNIYRGTIVIGYSIFHPLGGVYRTVHDTTLVARHPSQT